MLPPKLSSNSRRVSLEVALAGLVALATIVAILAGAFSIGEKQLQELRSPATPPPPAVIAPMAIAHAATGLQAPAPLPLAGCQPGADRFPAPNPAAEPDDSTDTAAPPPPAPTGPPSLAAIAPAVPPDENRGAAPRRMALSEYLGFTQFTKLRDAYLDRPDPRVNPGQFQRPQALSDLSVAHAESRIAPPTMGQVIAGGQSYSQLSQQRAQARLNRTGLATTQPVIQ